MRYSLLLLTCCMVAWSAPSQSASTDCIDITAYGVMFGPPGVQDGVSSGGIVHRRAGGKVVENTTRIPACIGTRFGIMYSLAGVPDITPIVEIYTFPRSGLHKPDASFPLHETRFESWLVPGMRESSMWYEFDRPWEMVPGKWTFELRDGNRLLASKTFTVVVPKHAECQSLST